MQNGIPNFEEKFHIDEYDFEESYYTFEEQKCLQMVFETIHEVLLYYNDILLQISHHACHCPTSYSLGKTKFEEVRKHLFEFLYMHKDFIKLNAIVFKRNQTNISKKVRFYYLEDASKLIDINSYLKVVRKDNIDDTSIEDFKKLYSIKLVIIYNRKNTLRSLKNFFGVNELFEKGLANLNRKYFIGNKIFPKTYQTASYKNLLKHLKDCFLEHSRNVKLMYTIMGVIIAYAVFIYRIMDININSNDYLLHVRKFDEVLKEFYEFAVAHKSIFKLKNVHIIQTLKTKTKFAKVIFDYSNNGLNFLNFDKLNDLIFQDKSWQNCGIRKPVMISCSFDFNNQNLKKMISSSTNKSVNSVEELERLCYETFLGKTKAKNNQNFSSYKELRKILSKREDFFYEGKVSRTYFNQLCSKYDGSKDENREMLKCNICFDDLKIGAEVCRLPCGHFNCKTCIERWFDIKTENFDEYTYQTSNEDVYETSVEEDNETLDENETAPDNNVKETSDEYQVKTVDKDEGENSNVNSCDEAKASDSEASTIEEDTVLNLVGLPVVVDNDKPSSDVYWNEYEVDDNEEQKSRNQCPTCKHICS